MGKEIEFPKFISYRQKDWEKEKQHPFLSYFGFLFIKLLYLKLCGFLVSHSPIPFWIKDFYRYQNIASESGNITEESKFRLGQFIPILIIVPTLFILYMIYILGYFILQLMTIAPN